jgi:hypothetical protein
MALLDQDAVPSGADHRYQAEEALRPAFSGQRMGSQPASPVTRATGRRTKAPSTRSSHPPVATRVAKQLFHTTGGPLRRRAIRDRYDTEAIRRVEIRKEGFTAATLPAGDDSHIEAGVAACPFPDHRPPSFKGRRWAAHRPQATAWASAPRR